MFHKKGKFNDELNETLIELKWCCCVCRDDIRRYKELYGESGDTGSSSCCNCNGRITMELLWNNFAHDANEQQSTALNVIVDCEAIDVCCYFGAPCHRRILFIPSCSARVCIVVTFTVIALAFPWRPSEVEIVSIAK